MVSTINRKSSFIPTSQINSQLPAELNRVLTPAALHGRAISPRALSIFLNYTRGIGISDGTLKRLEVLAKAGQLTADRTAHVLAPQDLSPAALRTVVRLTQIENALPKNGERIIRLEHKYYTSNSPNKQAKRAEMQQGRLYGFDEFTTGIRCEPDNALSLLGLNDGAIDSKLWAQLKKSDTWQSCKNKDALKGNESPRLGQVAGALVKNGFLLDRHVDFLVRASADRALYLSATDKASSPSELADVKLAAQEHLQHIQKKYDAPALRRARLERGAKVAGVVFLFATGIAEAALVVGAVSWIASKVLPQLAKALGLLARVIFAPLSGDEKAAKTQPRLGVQFKGNDAVYSEDGENHSVSIPLNDTAEIKLEEVKIDAEDIDYTAPKSSDSESEALRQQAADGRSTALGGTTPLMSPVATSIKSPQPSSSTATKPQAAPPPLTLDAKTPRGLPSSSSSSSANSEPILVSSTATTQQSDSSVASLGVVGTIRVPRG